MSELITVESLRKQGYKVRVIHERWIPDEEGSAGMGLHSRHAAEYYGLDWLPTPTGGNTIIQITTPEGDSLEGFAECSFAENFDRKFGIQLALARAMIRPDLRQEELPKQFKTNSVRRYIVRDRQRKEKIARKLQIFNKIYNELSRLKVL